MPPKKAAVLPTKERSLFARLIQEYETKKYKIGLKTADSILKKFPEHGETLCMKGLILGMMERRTEGIELAKKGVRYDITSFIAWHALGILNRQDHNYAESIKCYQQALRIDGGNNVNLLRETSFLFVQERMFPSLVESRLTLLKMQPHVRFNWTGLAVAHHLAGSLDQAVRVMEGFENANRDIPKGSHEQNEILLYHASLLAELGRHEDVIKYLDSKPPGHILDTKAAALLRGNAHLALGQHEAAADVFTSLMKRNAEEKSYLEGWLRSQKVEGVPSSDEEHERAAAAFTKLQELFPLSSAARRLALAYLRGDAFRSQAEQYVAKALRKGVPTIFGDLRSLYADTAKQQALEDIVEGLRQEWAGEASDGQEPPSSYVWALYYLAQHYSWIGRHEVALDFISSAIAHSPALAELHMMRARILKRAGSLVAAAHAMQAARILDGQDRFLNSKAAKYQLRIDQPAEATRIVGLFTKPDAPDPVFDLLEMQAFWYLAEEAESWDRLGNYAMALKRHGQIDKTLVEMYQDQLDFHSYCMRKFTLRSYIDAIRFEDGLRSRSVNVRSALAKVDICLRIHDQPALKKGQAAAAEANGELTEEQRKEAKKAKKAELKAQEEARKKEAKAKPEPKKVADDDELPPPPKDEDPQGTAFLASLDALAEAEKVLRSLHTHAASNADVWIATFDFARRSGNWLLGAQAVARTLKLSPHHPDLARQVVELRRASEKETSAPVKAAIEHALAEVLPAGKSIDAYTTEQLQRPSQTSAALLGVAKAVVAARGEAGRDEAFALMLQMTRAEHGADLPSLLRAKAWLASGAAGPAAERMEEFRQAASKAFPRADAFKTAAQVLEEDKARQDEDAAWAASTEAEAEA